MPLSTDDKNININDVTTINKDMLDVALSSGSFDRFMMATRAQLKDAVDNQEITQSEAGTALAQSIVGVLNASMEFELKRISSMADVALKEKNTELAQAQIVLTERQTEGFDDNKKQKLFEAQMNSWALMFSSGTLTTKPAIISNDSVSDLYNDLVS